MGRSPANYTGFDLSPKRHTDSETINDECKMKEYLLKTKIASSGVSVPWSADHPFYASATALAFDMGIEGIGITLRKGPKVLWAQTIEVSLPDAAPLSNRRAKRAGRRTRLSRRFRDREVKQWCVEHGLLSEEQTNRLWEAQNALSDEDPKFAKRVFEHRLRAVTNGVASPEAIAVCLRHIVKHRGFDYHQTEESSNPWGEGWDYSDMVDWLRTTPISADYAANLERQIKDLGDAFKENQVVSLMREMAGAVKRYNSEPVLTMLREHCKEKGHPNLRTHARRHNFPRELMKEHAFQIMEKHRHFFGEGQFEKAVRRLLGKRDDKGQWLLTEREGKGKTMTNPGAIMDHHRRTRAEAMELWERKVGKCPYAEHLHAKGFLIDPHCKRDKRRLLSIRQFMLLQFLAERTFVASNFARHYTCDERVKWCLEFIAQDDVAMTGRTPRPKLGRDFQKEWAQQHGIKLAGAKVSHNGDFFDQLKDLLCPQSGFLEGRASLSEKSAALLVEVGTDKGRDFTPESMLQRWRDLGYYQWRVNNVATWGFYPQVEFLLGSIHQYDAASALSNDTRTSDACRKTEPKDKRGCARADGKPQEHGILRRLFADQLVAADGQPVRVREQMNRADGLPDYVIVEVIGDMPRNTEQAKEIHKANKDRRLAKQEIFDLYHIDHSAPDGMKEKALLFHQQVNAGGNLVCPYTGEVFKDLTPQSRELEVEHIFPQRRGGIKVMGNLCLTHRRINGAKDNGTPREIAGKTLKDVTFLPWLAMKAGLVNFRWGKAKRAIFEHEGDEVPDFGNTTRMAQLARQLRSQVAEWLGIRRRHSAALPDPTACALAIQKETWERIGTPSGGMTHTCAETWCPPTKFPDYWKEITRNGAVDQVKERLCQRHHLWDAIILSHIPPGVGLNSTVCGGIFQVRKDESTGCIKLSPLPELGPDLDVFNKSKADTCLVISPRQRRSKKSRTLENPYSPADDKGRHWMREALSKYTAKDKTTMDSIIKLLRDAGIPLKRFGEDEASARKYLQKWFDERNPERFEKQELLDFLGKQDVLTQGVRDAFDEWWKNEDGSAPLEKKVTAAALYNLLKKGGFTKEQLGEDGMYSKAVLSGWIVARVSSAELRLPSFKDGQPGQVIRRIRVEQDKKAAASYFPHHNRESRASGEPIGVKATNEACRIFRIYQQLTKDDQGKVIKREYWRLKIPPPRNLHNYEKIHGRKWQPDEKDNPPQDAELLGELTKGQLLRIPIGANQNFAKRGAPATHGWWWYRVAALNDSDGEMKLELAEYKEPKEPPKDKIDRRDVKEKLIAEIWKLRPKSQPDLAYFIELNTPQRVHEHGWKIISADAFVPKTKLTSSKNKLIAPTEDPQQSLLPPDSA